MEEKRKFRIGLESTTPLNMARFSGQENIDALSPKEQAERKVYRLPNDNLAFPTLWLRFSLVNAFVDKAPKKEKVSTRIKVTPRILVNPPMVSLGFKDYEIDSVSVPDKSHKMRHIDYHPQIEKWSIEAELITTLPESDRELKKMLEYAGSDVGVGGSRTYGYGRFAVTKFDKIE